MRGTNQVAQLRAGHACLVYARQGVFEACQHGPSSIHVTVAMVHIMLHALPDTAGALLRHGVEGKAVVLGSAESAWAVCVRTKG